MTNGALTVKSSQVKYEFNVIQFNNSLVKHVRYSLDLSQPNFEHYMVMQQDKNWDILLAAELSDKEVF